MKKSVLTLGFLLFLTPMLAWSETVFAKYFGSVDLSEYRCLDTVSSFVNRICYNDENSTAVVLLKSTYYAYCRIPSNVVSGWINAPSKGRYYNNRIKGRYRC